MRLVVAAVVEREDRRLLIGQRRRSDTSALKWEFPGGKVREGEGLEEALARELREELGVTVLKSRKIGQVRHRYANTAEEWEIHFFAVKIAEKEITPRVFEQIAWVLKGEMDFPPRQQTAGPRSSRTFSRHNPRHRRGR